VLRVIDVGRQGDVLRRAAMAGVPVPPVVWTDTAGEVLGAPALLAARVEGETLPRRILREPGLAAARAGFADECGRILAALHRTDTRGLDLPAPDALEEVRRSLDTSGEPRPAFEVAYRWLAERRPPATATTLVHGDFRLGNLVVDGHGVAAVLDWELAHLGDPLEDLGWLCSVAWRFGEEMAVGGMGGRESLYEAYETAGGPPVDRGAARWWEVLASLSWGAICQRQARRHLLGLSRSMELAAIGRRVCESEWDLIHLLRPGSGTALSGGGAPSGGGVSGDPTGGLHGRPTAAELVRAVAEWLEGDIGPATGEAHRFHVRVATHVLATVGREIDLGPAQRAAHRVRLDALGYEDDAALAGAIRAGEVGDADAEVWDAVAAGVRDRLAVANPGYLLRGTGPDRPTRGDPTLEPTGGPAHDL
jgi:aminoglycoside phosphotransferase (APT) family kinase protein